MTWTENSIPYKTKKTRAKINLFEPFRIIILIPSRREELRLFSEVLILFFATKQDQLGKRDSEEWAFLGTFQTEMESLNPTAAPKPHLSMRSSFSLSRFSLEFRILIHWAGSGAGRDGEYMEEWGQGPPFCNCKGRQNKEGRSVAHRGNCNTARAILHTVCSSACQGTAISVFVDVQEQETLPKHNWRLTNNFRSLC